MANTTKTANQKIVDRIHKDYEVIQSSEFGNGASVVFEASGSVFAAVTRGESGLNVYKCYADGPDWKFLPTFKSGKSFRTITNFIAARA